jgi:hypothetical protein
VETAIARREIVRTWSMRGTWHFVPAADVRWMQDLLASRQLPAIRRRSADFGFDEADVSRARRLVVKALEGGHQRPRAELIQRLAAAGFRTDEQGGNHLLRRFGNEGLICQGEFQGREPAFALRDEWIPRPVLLEREAALAEIARRFFRSHGPATEHDFAWWTGLPLGEARTAIGAAGRTLERHLCNDHEHWTADETGDPPPAASATLLPAFDEHLLGYQDRSAVLDAAFADAVAPGGNGVFRPTLVVKGRVAGLWQKKVSVKQLVLEITPRLPLAPVVQRGIAQAADRLGAFHQRPVAIRIG